ncbi:T9SS type A sorting domain-containing protein [Aquimarina sp. TRL1]|uniref:C10 family peptidase n=1 Tax=Aquimarina sp. (strain TRL1) TaxID=2736252 RepID=UPI0015888EDA|nr:C10 family peptidase [Aquimarina sp. TRL1]QKX05805.1 T9SS type A sorting domain-containing protein [Aquimarina sp. TRL1]
MKRILSITFSLLLLLYFDVHANSIDRNTAIKIANQWIGSQTPNSKSAVKKEVQTIQEVQYKNTLVYYIITYTNGGFIIISADDTAKPILGYSNQSILDISVENPAITQWLDNYKKYVYQSIEYSKTSKSNNKDKGWELLKNPVSRRKTNEVLPFMDDILYSQGAGWNKQCPEDGEGRDGHALVGCVATAMAQVIRYWEFPKTGRGSETYNHSKYGAISANFGATTYNWQHMSKSRPDQENAKLLFHCGVAVNMNYGAKSSGAYTHDVPGALKTYFKYDTAARLVNKYNYSQQAWSDLMKKELEERRPVLYSGRSTLTKPAGHLFVLDGYQITEQGDYFHINWGWGGRTNGYFYLNKLITHNGDHNWVKSNAAIINLKPANIPPVITSSPSTILKTTEIYQYPIQTFDENDDAVSIAITEGPSWLQIKQHNAQYILEGTPPETATGVHKVVLKVKDAATATTQTFYLQVLKKGTSVEQVNIDFTTGDFSQANFSFGGNKKWIITTDNARFHASSPEIGDKTSTSLSMTETFAQETVLSFDFKVSSEEKYDYLKFYIDGKEISKWSGEVQWNTVSYLIPEGTHTIMWSYVKDDSVKKGADRAWIDVIRYIKPGTPGTDTSVIDFETKDYSQAAFSFKHGTWELVDTHSPFGYSSKSNTITDNQETSISISKDFATNTDMHFDIKISSEKDYDYLIFMVDGKEEKKWSGIFDWQRISFSIPKGTHTISWVYKKDYSVSSGEDAAWIDNIEFTSHASKNAITTEFNQEKTNVSAKQHTKLYQNYPNPVSTYTDIQFSLAKQEMVTLEIVDFSGTKIATVLHKNLAEGTYRIAYDASKLTKNMYFIRLITSESILTRKMIVKQ